MVRHLKLSFWDVLAQTYVFGKKYSRKCGVCVSFYLLLKSYGSPIIIRFIAQGFSCKK